MTRTRIKGTAAIAGLMLAAGAATAAPAGAASEAGEAGGGYEINRGAVVHTATYYGATDGVRGNVHDIAIESEGDGNYVHSYFCPTGANRYTKKGCTMRSDYRFIPEKSPTTFWVSSTRQSARIDGQLKAMLFGHTYNRTFDVDLAVYATYDHDGDGGIYRADGTFAGNSADRGARGFLTLD